MMMIMMMMMMINLPSIQNICNPALRSDVMREVETLHNMQGLQKSAIQKILRQLTEFSDKSLELPCNVVLRNNIYCGTSQQRWARTVVIRVIMLFITAVSKQNKYTTWIYACGVIGYKSIRNSNDDARFFP
jgi:hypothetical protein